MNSHWISYQSPSIVFFNGMRVFDACLKKRTKAGENLVKSTVFSSDVSTRKCMEVSQKCSICQ